MALGTNSMQSNRNGLYEPNYYARLRFINDDSKKMMGFSYWKGALKVSISERSESGAYNELAYIHLSPAKATILADCIDQVIKNPKSNPVGVNTGMSETQGLFVVHRDKDGVPYVIIAKVDSAGTFVSNTKFKFNKDYNYGLEFDGTVDDLKFSKNYYNELELIQLKTIMEDYSRSANGAFGASVWDVARYETARSNNIINAIADKIGVERRGFNGGGSGNSFFNSNNSSSSSFTNRDSKGLDGAMNRPYSVGDINELDEEFS